MAIHDEHNSYIDPHYLRHSNKFDLLESEEEFILAKKWKDQMDPKAAHRLISSHLRLVNKIAQGYKGYGLPVADIISEGHIGIMQALKRFEPEKGFRFSTYAIWWIKAYIQQFVLTSWSLVKMGTTPQQRKLFFNLKKLKHALGIEDIQSLSLQEKKEVCEKLQVSFKDLEEMNSRLSQPDRSLNTPLNAEEGAGEWQDLICSEAEDQEASIIYKDELEKRKKVLEQSLGVLPPRENEILLKRRLQEPPETLDILAKKLGISKERVRQIEVQAIEKLRKIMVSHPALIQQNTKKTFLLFLINSAGTIFFFLSLPSEVGKNSL